MFGFGVRTPEKTTKKRAKKPQKSIKEILSDTLRKELLKNQDLATKISLKEFGYQDVGSKRKTPEELADEQLSQDPEYIAQIKEAKLSAIRGNEEMDQPSTMDMIEDVINNALVTKIQSNPALLDKVIESRLMGITGPPRSPNKTLTEFMETWKGIKEFETEMGGEKKDGPFGGLVDAEVIKTALQLFAPLFTGRSSQPQITEMKTYVLDTPQGLVETDALGYKQWLEMRGRAISSPQSQPQVQAQPKITVTEEPVIIKPEIEHPKLEEPTLQAINLEHFLDMESAEFANYLTEKVKTKDRQAGILYDMLLSHTPDTFISTMESIANTDETKNAVKRLKDQKDWLDEVINFLKVLKEN